MVITGLSSTVPMVFSVGPGLSTTYGTGSHAPVTPRASTRKPETIKGSARRHMVMSLIAGADPLRGPVGELLVFPDEHLGLERVDQLSGGLEGLSPMGAGHGHDDRDLPQGQLPHPVHGGERGDRVLGGHLLGH